MNQWKNQLKRKSTVLAAAPEDVKVGVIVAGTSAIAIRAIRARGVAVIAELVEAV